MKFVSIKLAWLSKILAQNQSHLSSVDQKLVAPPYQPQDAVMFRSLGNNLIAKNFKIKANQLTRSTQSVSYGCWCFFEEMPIMTGQNKPFKPKGRPVDKLDSYCKQLTEAYDCIAEFSKLDRTGSICQPRTVRKILSDTWWVDLNYDLIRTISDAELLETCLYLNGGINSCEVYVCMIRVAETTTFS